MTARTPDAGEIQAWLVARLAEELGLSPADIDVSEPYASYGLGSRDAVGISGDLEEWLGRRLSPTLLYDHPSIEALSRHLGGGDDASAIAASIEIDTVEETDPSPLGSSGQSGSSEPIAIVGLACRFPGAPDADAYWRLVSGGVDAIREVPADRWDNAALFDPGDPENAAPGKMNSRHGGFLDQVDRFEPAFFGISAHEAERLDPQQRLLLELTWEALEDAGLAPERLSGTATGVFVGISTNDYGRLQLEDLTRIDAWAGTGNARSIAANRISYQLGLSGPSLAVDTACSSSLVALHLACQSLRSGECGVALVGAVNVMLSPEVTMIFARAGLLAPDGRCKAFDARADGYVRGEGAGVVVLKPLSAALEAGDDVYAVIRGSAVNQDGRTNGLMAPSGPAQEAVIRRACRNAGIDPGEVHFVETHGTGTALGDRIEAGALGAAVSSASRQEPCWIGSVKTNIGHLEAAAGMAGLIKAVLALRHRQLPPSLHFETPSPMIDFADLGLRVADRAQPLPILPAGGEPVRAGVSSFGFGGTNAHVVLEEAPARHEELHGEQEDEGGHLLVLSARTPAALDAACARLASWLESHPEIPLGDVAFTLRTGRNAFEHRRAVLDRDRAEAVAILRSGKSTESPAEALPVPSQDEPRQARRRAGLPTYPFQRQRYWWEALDSGEPKRVWAALSPDEVKKPLEDWFHVPVWNPAPLDQVRLDSASPAPTSPSSVLVFCDEHGLGEGLATRFRQAGRPVVLVRPGADGVETDYEALLDGLPAPPGEIVHLWSVGGDPVSTLEQAEKAQKLGLESVVQLVRALGERPSPGTVSFTLVASGMAEVTGGDLVSPAKSTLLGPCRVIPFEYPRFTSRCVDVQVPDSPEALDLQIGHLLREIESRATVADVATVAYRGQDRYVESIVRTPLAPLTPLRTADGQRLRQGGVYLLTGGLGGLALSAARFLAERYRARLVLVSRTGLPPREDWASLRAEAEADVSPTRRASEAVPHRIREVMAIEEILAETGGELLLIEADVTDRAQMQAAVRQVLGRFGALHGVFHTAGVIGAGMIAFNPKDSLARVMPPKLAGTMVLDEVLEEVIEEIDLDFLVLYSSLAALVGGTGQVAYSAANGFLDAFAIHRTRRGRFTVSVGWGEWQWNVWEGFAPEIHAALEESRLRFGISPEEGFNALERILAQDRPHVAVLTRSFETLREWFLALGAETLGGSGSAAETPSSRPGGMPALPPREELERIIAGIWRRYFGVESLGLDDNFFDAGGNSLVGLQILSELRKTLGVELPKVAIFQAPTVRALARYLEGMGAGAAGAPKETPGAAAAASRPEAVEKDAIAIVAMALRFPGARSVDQFWENLSSGVEAVTYFTDEELDEVPPALLANPDYVKARPVLEDIDQFDAGFFNYSPGEARLMDPQIRLFLETCWEALESSGYAVEGLQDRVGVFAGSNISTYLLGLMRRPGFVESIGELETVITNDRDSLTTSTSYKLNLKGPSLTVQTFCSTSAVAIHLACKTLLHGECEMALAGGVSIRVPSRTGYLYRHGDQYSPDGHTRAFDHRARGTVFGDGVGVVVLKRLSAAVRDGDHIHAVIRGSAVNNDGSLKVGYTAPSIEGQSSVIASALADAGVKASEVSYVEAHGTATALGDPIEVAALTQAYRQQTLARRFCALGSVKTNIGHLDRAASVASVIKTALALQNRQIPPSLHFEKPNPDIPFDTSPFFVNDRLRDWTGERGPRRAGVNCLGIGGTNAHVVLEEAPAPAPASPSRRNQLLLLSARSETALGQAAARLARYLRGLKDAESIDDADLADVAYTLQVGRKVFSHRRAVVCDGRESAIQALEATDTIPAASGSPASRQVTFLFPGEGEHYPGMARGLYRDEPVFREQVDLCMGILREVGEDGLLDGFQGGDDEEAVRLLSQARHLHPVLFVVEHSLARLLMSWGVKPRALLGHGPGEIVAACLAGVFTLQDALRLVAARGRWIDEATDPETLADRVAELVGGMELRAPSVPFLSSATGGWVNRKQATNPRYWGEWADQSHQPDRIGEAVAELLGEAEQVLLEVGPGSALTSRVRLHPNCDVARAALAQPTLRSCSQTGETAEPGDDQAYLLTTLGRLWQQGLEIDWRGFYQGERRRRRPLPTYPFERERHWIDAPPAEGSTVTKGTRLTGAMDDLERRPEVEDWFYEAVWTPQPARAETEPAPRSAAPWLVFVDASLLAARLLERLASRGETVFTVTAGSGYAAEGSAWTLDPAEPDHYRRLVEDLGAKGDLPERILHLWNLNSDGGSLNETLDLGFHSLVYLARALSPALRGKVELNVVSSGAFAVTGEETLNPLRAMLAGPVQVVPMEYPSISIRHLDLELPAPGSGDEDRLLDGLISEIYRSPVEREIALRGGERRVRGFEPRPLARPAAISGAVWRQGGVYLITGGLGGLGLAAAEHLADACGARLALVGRTALPPREEWDRILAESDSGTGMARRIAKVRALEERGAEVLVLAADVTDRERMKEVVAEVLERFGAIHGVLHTAGVPAAGLMHGKSAADFASVLGAKVQGSLVLEEVLEEVLSETPLDVFVLFSSITAILGGGPGQVDYSAANAFLDAFAQARTRSGIGRRVVSIDWGEWLWNDWESSMAGLPPEALASFRRNRERLGIDFAGGMDALERILASDLANVVVSPPNFNAMRAITREYTFDLLLGQPAGREVQARPAAALTPRELEGWILESWRQALGREQIGLDDNFFDLGGNSLLGLRVTTELQRELRREVLPLALYEAPTVRSLAAYLQPPVLEAPAADVGGTRSGGAPGSQGARQGIAIVGMAGRFPGAANTEELWRNLLDGRESITFFSDEELLAAGVDPGLLANPRYVKAGAVLENIDRFDAELFGESPREAELLDPQLRLFMECSWEALDDAGCDPRRHPGRIGVFGGSNLSTYLLQMAASPELAGLVHPMLAGLGNSSDALTTRVSYKLNLRGPSVSVQTFCSTSGVAAHMACESLERGECDMALAGGVRVVVPHRVGYLHEPGGIESPDGHIRTFDARGRGMVLGNGVAILVLKRLEAAVADGDHIYAVIKGSAINNDGSGKIGYTAPSVNAVAETVSRALENAQVAADTISYVEAHGTATEVGDPIEMAALTRAFRAHSAEPGRVHRVQYCAIGSVKSNLGHLDRAAGATALIKTALALQRGELPPSISFEEPNPKLDLERSPFYVQTERTPWATADGQPRRAGVNVQGIGGTNVHFILEEPPAEVVADRPSRPLQMLVLSANSATALEAQTDRLAAHLRQAGAALDLPDVSSTLHRGRQLLKYRRFVVCRNLLDHEDAVACLESRDEQRVFSHYEEPGRRPVCFLFPGQGAQYPGMGRGLYEQEAVFRSEVDRCCDLLKPLLGRDLREILFPASGDAGATEAAGRELARTELTHPALFVVEYALARQWMAWGVQPDWMIGHSLGEYVAACLAGVFALSDALALVVARGRLISEVEPGAMLNVPLPEAEIAALLGPELSLAAVNGPSQCTVSGPEAPLADLEAALAARGVRTGRLRTSHAFHSAMMDPVLERFRERVSAVPRNAPRQTWISNVTGVRIQAEQAVDPDYWVEHLRQPVRFADGIREPLNDPRAVFLEVGPGRNLTTLVARQAQSDPVLLASLRPPQQDEPDLGFLLDTLGRLWLTGVEVDWDGFYREENRRRVPLPAYPFEGERYWLGPRGAVLPATRAVAPSGVKKADPADWYYRPSWRPSPLPVPSSEGEAAGGSWLLLVDELGVGRRVAESLKANGSTVAMAAVGARFEKVSSLEWRLDPSREDDYRRLLQELGFQPDRVVHLWSLTGGLAEPQTVGFFSLLRLARALGAERVRGARLTVVTNRLEDILGGEPVEADRSTLAAVLKVLRQEVPGLASRLIEIDPEPATTDQAPLVAELRHGSAADLEVAWRNGSRWLRHFEPVRLEPAAEPSADSTSGLRDGGVYLITGGLGGVGLLLAEELALRHRARLALVGRSGLLERGQWQQWRTEHGEDDPTSRKIRRIERLEELGAEVLVLAADVADPAAMRAALESVESAFGELHGVLHAAGVTSRDAFQPVQLTGDELCERHFRAKVRGVEVLGEVLGDRPLDICLLFSSLSSVLGGLGFAAYAAANAYLNGFAQARRRAGDARWLSVAWDAWRLDGGSHSEAETSMTPEEGVEAFGRILSARAADPTLGPVLVHSTGDLEARLDQWLRRVAKPAAPRAPRVETTRYTRPNLRTAYAPVNSEAERKVARVFEEVLGVEKVGIHDNYFDLGGTSLTALQVVSELQQEFPEAEITPVLLFESPTVAGLAKALGAVDGGEEALDRLRAAVDEGQAQAPTREGIAIVGMSGRFPGAPDLDRFWQNLVNGVESVSYFTDEELLESGVDPALFGNPDYVRARPILPGVDQFDAGFFGYSPREAELMDPQMRILMETCWEALEGAGYAPGANFQKIGMFAGSNFSTYFLSQLRDPGLLDSVGDLQASITNDRDSLATSISYKLNLKGPSLTVQTFCSTSAVAVHLASQSLRQGDCTMALAGGVSLRVPAKAGYLYQKGDQVSPDGHTRTFDHRAGGTVFGDGVGVLVLKRLSDALRDGDQVHAVLRGSAINNDGSGKVGYTAPSVEGQAEVVATALANAGVDASQIGYVEAHGTATVLGDPIEVTALTRAFRLHTAERGYCPLGSVKTNLGHLDRAAGVTALIKTALALEHGQIPPNLHFERPNPQIDFESSPFFVNTRLREWKRNGRPRLAGVNSLGVGGTNVHLVLEEAPELPPASESRRHQLLVVSARSEAALEASSSRLAAHLESAGDGDLPDVAYTLQVGRKELAHRRIVVGADRTEMLAQLRGDGPPAAGSANVASIMASAVQEPVTRPVAFLFPGIGEHYVGMAQGLYRDERVFRDEVDRCAEILAGQGMDDLTGILYPRRPASSGSPGGRPGGLDLRALLRGNGREDDASAALNRIANLHPALFVVEYSLARLLMSWGVVPQAMLGYSLGEYVAACLSGVFSLEDALRLVAARGRWIEELPEGAMLAIPLSEEEIAPELGDDLDLAAANGVGGCVVAGLPEAVAELEKRLAGRDQVSRRLQSTRAFHSRQLDPVAGRVIELLSGMAMNAPQIPFISNVTGTWITAEQATDPAYWAHHLCRTVRFGDGVTELLKEPSRVLVEVGPGQGLTSFVRLHPDCGAERAPRVRPTVRTPFEQRDDQSYLLECLGRLWLSGVAIDWRGFHVDERRRRRRLPTYPFERQSYWLGTRPAPPALGIAETGVARALAALERQPNVDDWFSVPVWKRAPRAEAAGPTAPGPWWLFLDGERDGTEAYGAGALLALRLEQRGDEVYRIFPGPRYRRDGRVFSLDPGSPEHYERLVRELAGEGALPGRVVHLWDLQDDARADAGLGEILDRGFHSLIYLAQALGPRAGAGTKVTVSVVSRGVHRVAANDTLRPDRATVMGPVTLIPLEYPALACRHIDVPADRPEPEPRLVDQLLMELTPLDTPADELCVAYRAGERYVRTFERERLPSSPAAQSPRFRRNGVYLVTGGLGGLGLATAEHLAASLRARLVLVGRTALPPREEWDAILTAVASGDRESGTARAISRLRALEEQGIEILTLQADVADRGQMRAAVAAARERFGALHGVFHTAGVPGAGLMQTKTAADFARVLGPKVMGTRVLDEVLRPVPLDFLVLFSSATAVTGGGPGQVDYCAANAFLDAFAQARSTADRFVVSIGWNEWRWNAWGGAMDGLPPQARRFFAETRERLGIDFAGGMDALERIVASDRPYFVVSPPDFGAALALSPEYTVDLFLGKPDGARPASEPAVTVVGTARRHARAELKVAYVPPASDLERRIASLWQRELGIEAVGLSDNFFDLGGNSLIGLKVTAELQRDLGREVLPLALYEAPTVGDLARYLRPAQPAQPAQPVQPARPEKTESSRLPVAAGPLPEEGIAIVGMAGRFPRAASVDELWRNLLDGREGVTFFGDQELLDAGVDPELLADPLYVKAGGVLDDIERFDADLFDVPPEEAALLDPQHRLFLETAWAALEDAGHDPARYPDRIGVFGGSHLSTYLLHLAATPALHRSFNRRLVGQCNSTDTLTTRVSYKLNLRGPSVAVQTFSSTSGVAIHLACESLQRRSCEMALAGGVQVSVPHRVGYLTGSDGIDSQDGHTRSFDAQARGALQGNGVAIVVLKRLADALHDGDHIYAVIKGSAINNDGSGKVGFTAPSVNAVADVVTEALEKAGVSPETVSYVEATGGATEIGDAMEVAALTRAFRAASGDAVHPLQYCALGSVKSSVGHLLIASGATAVIKTALALRHGQIPPNPTFREANPQLLLEQSPFYVQKERTPWPRDGAPRRAGVNIQGVGGTNVHLILEEPPTPPITPVREASSPWQLLVLSANTASALEAMTDRLAARLRDARGELGLDLDLADVCATLQQGRRLLRHRRFVVCRDLEDAVSCLESRDPRRVSTHFEPHAALSPPPTAADAAGDATGDASDPAAALEILGRLWQRGVDIDWQAFRRHERRLRVPLPTYPFEGARHWLGSPAQEPQHSQQQAQQQAGPETEIESVGGHARTVHAAGRLPSPKPLLKEGSHEELV